MEQIMDCMMTHPVETQKRVDGVYGWYEQQQDKFATDMKNGFINTILSGERVPIEFNDKGDPLTSVEFKILDFSKQNDLDFK